MRLGLIARGDNRGLGQQTWEFHRHMRPAKTMVVDCPSAKPLPLHLERFPDAMVVHRWPTETDVGRFLLDLDVVFSCETFYTHGFTKLAHRMDVKTVLQPNVEFLDKRDAPDLWAAPSMWRYAEIPDPKIFLPAPIATDRFVAPADFPTAGSAHHFLHIVGRPAIHDRNGTMDLLKALRYVESDIEVTIRCQEPGYVEQLIDKTVSLGNTTVCVETGDTENYWDHYTGQDVLVMPRRFGGLSLPVNEALGAGMPVIMPDISPNNLWLPSEWLVPAGWCHAFRAKQRVDVYSSNHRALAAKIDQFATDTGFYTKATQTALELRQQYSWDTLKPRYEEVLSQ